MNEKKEKLKKFVREHRNEIIVGSVCMIIGIKRGKALAHKANMKALGDAIIATPKTTQYLADAGDALKNYSAIRNPEVTKVIVFTK